MRKFLSIIHLIMKSHFRKTVSRFHECFMSWMFHASHECFTFPYEIWMFYASHACSCTQPVVAKCVKSPSTSRLPTRQAVWRSAPQYHLARATPRCVDVTRFMRGRHISHAWTSHYSYMDVTLSCVNVTLFVHGRHTIHAWTSHYSCVDVTLFTHGRTLFMQHMGAMK